MGIENEVRKATGKGLRGTADFVSPEDQEERSGGTDMVEGQSLVDDGEGNMVPSTDMVDDGSGNLLPGTPMVGDRSSDEE
ncbi:hypothetical protein ACFVUN_35830 [Kitasatospora griseola]|uniref:hypothetical protein n=1 Tax=Kitasatospora griseola TaxID=2064 RepID=UPI0036DEFFD2